MELRQLEYFVAVAEEANFTRAAERAHVAQPAVSAQIRRLERELGQVLLDRSARAVGLTEAGAVVLPYARAALAAVAGARAAVDALTGLLHGHLRIGTVGSIHSPEVDVAALLAGFHHDHPAVEMTLSVGSSDQLGHALRTGALDLAFIGLGAGPPAELTVHVLASSSLLAVVAPDHPLAGVAAIDLRAVAEHPLISMARGTGLRTCLDHACADLGIVPHVAYEVADPGMAARLAAHGFGVAVVPESVATAGRASDLHRLRITTPGLRSALAMAWRATGPSSPAARALISHIRVTAPGPSAVPAAEEG
jgi:DNA-binding transcriptional LysR family regulator